MKCVCFQSMGIASTKKVVKEDTTFKNVKLMMNVTISRHVKKDIQKYAKSLQIETHVSLDMDVPTVTKIQSKIKNIRI